MKNSLYNFISLFNGAVRANLVEFSTDHFSKSTLLLSRLFAKLGFINGFSVQKRRLTVYLKYFDERPVVKQIKIVSKPSRRVFVNATKIEHFLKRLVSPEVYRLNLFLAVFSLPKLGFQSHYQALISKKGGEFLFIVYV
jgi:small subunit ribosomal protein S8